MQSAAEQAPTHQGAPAGGLTSHPGSLRPTEIPEGPDDMVALRDHGFTDVQLSDAVQVISYFNYVNRIADGLGVDLEDDMPPPG